MEWLARFLLGFPPRPGSSDKESFSRTFPESKSAQDIAKIFKQNIFLIHFPPFDDENSLNIHAEAWINSSDNLTNHSEKECKSASCPLRDKNSAEQSQTGAENNNFFNFMYTPTGGHTTDGMAQIVFDKLTSFAASIEQVKSIHIVDPYIYSNLGSSNAKAENYLNKLLTLIEAGYAQCVVRLYSNTTNPEVISKVRAFAKQFHSVQLFQTQKDDWHDRPIVVEGLSTGVAKGVLVGTSVDAIIGKKRYYVTLLEDKDAEDTLTELASATPL